MTDNELLLAISDMIDNKLDSKLAPMERKMQSMHNDMQQMKTDMQFMQNDMQQMKSDMQLLKTDVQQTKTEMQQMKTEMQFMQNDMQQMKSDMQFMQNDMQQMKTDMQFMQNDMQQMKIFQENTILPRLDTITSCYTDTYDRYKDGADRMEAAFDDIRLLKKVVSEHSRELQNIS